MSNWTTLFDRRGFQTHLAKKSGLTKSTINGWRNGIPPKHCAMVEKECGREFTRRDFCPDDWAYIWPELVNKTPKPKAI